MSAPRSPAAPRDVLDVDWPFFGELCRALALHVSRSFDPELVIGIAEAGVIPAVIVARILQRPFLPMAITRLHEGDAPVIRQGPPASIRGRRILLVDETCDSGDTLKLALSATRALEPADVRTAVSFTTGRYRTDFHAFATEKAIILPWDREVVENGELVVRPHLRAWLDR